MPYSPSLADRVRQVLRLDPGITEKKMFGGICFMMGGNILVGVWEWSLTVRLGPQQAAFALTKEHVRPFDDTGRPMKGWIVVEPDGLESEQQLAAWIEKAIAWVETLPAK
jgi:TfoX/Sxy family transcriptional regulator of competence genes